MPARQACVVLCESKGIGDAPVSMALSEKLYVSRSDLLAGVIF